MHIQFSSGNTFNAKVGPSLLKQVEHEFNNNKEKVDKFAKLFDAAHSETLDINTVVDVNSDNHYIMSHLSFPNIFCTLREKINDNNKPISDKLINECAKVFGWGELLLYQEITRNSVNKMGFDNFEEFVKNNIKTPKNQRKFLEIIDCAKKLLQKDPNSKLTDIDFEIMSNTILNEKINTPGTEEYEQIHKLITIVHENKNSI